MFARPVSAASTNRSSAVPGLRVEQVPLAAAVGGSEARDGPVEMLGEVGGDLAFCILAAGDCNVTDHRGVCGKVVDVPVPRLIGSPVARQASGQAPLGRTDVEVHSGRELEPPQPPDAYRPRLSELKYRDVQAGVHVRMLRQYL